MAQARPTLPVGPVPEALLTSPGFLVVWLADRLAERYDQAIGEFGVRSSQHAVLAYTAELGPLRQARLGERLRVDHATFVTAINELERRGLLRRGPDATDRRTLVVELTVAGRELLRSITQAVQRIEDDVYAGLTARQRSDLTRALRTVVGDLDSDAPGQRSTPAR